jgi:hypothetical protein
LGDHVVYIAKIVHDALLFPVFELTQVGVKISVRQVKHIPEKILYVSIGGILWEKSQSVTDTKTAMSIPDTFA